MESVAQHIEPNPRKSANFLSVITFAWTISIFRRGWKRPFDSSSTYETLDEDRSSSLGDRLEKYDEIHQFAVETIDLTDKCNAYEIILEIGNMNAARNQNRHW